MDEEIEVRGVRRKIEAVDADLSGSTFTGVKLANAFLKDVNLAGTTFVDCNLTEARIENANLLRIQISDADLSGAAIDDCVTDGMTIDGISVSTMMAAYRAANGRAT